MDLTYPPLHCSQISVESVSQWDGRTKRSRFSDEQIIGIVKEQEAAAVTAAKRLRTLEEENAKLKKLLAEAMLDIAVLKDISSKKW